MAAPKKKPAPKPDPTPTPETPKGGDPLFGVKLFGGKTAELQKRLTDAEQVIDEWVAWGNETEATHKKALEDAEQKRKDDLKTAADTAKKRADETAKKLEEAAKKKIDAAEERAKKAEEELEKLKKAKPGATPSKKALEDARAEGYVQGHEEGYKEGYEAASGETPSTSPAPSPTPTRTVGVKQLPKSIDAAIESAAKGEDPHQAQVALTDLARLLASKAQTAGTRLREIQTKTAEADKVLDFIISGGSSAP